MAAGILAYGVRALQTVGWLPGLSNTAFDVSPQFELSSWYGAVLKGVFNLGPQMTVLEVAVYLGYLIPTMILFLRPVPSVAPVRTPAVATVGEPAH